MQSFLSDIRQSDQDVINKIQQKSKKVKYAKNETKIDKVTEIRRSVQTTFLENEINNCSLITTTEAYKAYIQKCLKNGTVAIDTETSGLSPIFDICAGLCLYTPGESAVYIPINHIDPVTMFPVEENLPVEIIREGLEELKSCKEILMHNALFDMKVMFYQLGVKVVPTWDTQVAGRLLYTRRKFDDNSLKGLYQRYYGRLGQDKYSFSDLFKNFPFPEVPLDCAYVYAAQDAYMTYKIYEKQKRYFRNNSYPSLGFIMREIEVPIIEVTFDMCARGVRLDHEYAKKMQEEYAILVSEAEQKIIRLLEPHKEKIVQYRMRKGDECKLPEKINFVSSQQLAILFYDILEYPLPKKQRRKNASKTERPTNEETMKLLGTEISLAVLDHKKKFTLKNNFIDKLPGLVNPDTGKIHASFDPTRTDTGRFACEDPNLQQIPSRGNGKEVRKMFLPTEGYYMISIDYSAQEPRITTHLCDDPKMKATYNAGEDLYAKIASLCFSKPYEECLDKWPNGKDNPDGYKRRASAKQLVLGICYGKSIPSIAEELASVQGRSVSIDEAQGIYDSVLDNFPNLRIFMQYCVEFAKDHGYTETMFGRRRNMTAIQFDEFVFSTSNEYLGEGLLDFSPTTKKKVPKEIQWYYLNRLEDCPNYYAQRDIIKEAALGGIIIEQRPGYDNEARQCINTPIQGSAADQMKIAMLKIHRDQLLKDLDAHIIIQVHDELICECPKENIVDVTKRLKYLMETAVSDYLSVPTTCDIAIFERWEGEKLEGVA